MTNGLRIAARALLVLASAACADGQGRSGTAPRLAATPPDGATAAATLDPQAARRQINAYRAGKGLKPLALDPRLARAAERHAADLARHGRIAHEGSDGSNPWGRVRKAGFEPQLAAENVGAGQVSFDEVLAGWKDSLAHNRNLLLPDATHMGVALATAPGTRYRTYWALVLGAPR